MHPPPPRVDIGQQKPNSRAHAAVADNGIGAPADEGHGGEKAGEKTEGAQRPPPGWTACMAGEAIDLSLYSRLMALLATTNDLNPHLRSLGWVITRMDELYDARRRAEQASYNAEEDYLNLDSDSRKDLPFPAFVYRHFKNRHGIKHMVRSVCIDLVCNLQLYRKQRPDVEVFARFMEEFYGQKELSFFLDLRTEAHRVARVGTRRLSVGTQPVLMTLPDCVRVAKGVFIDSTTLYFRDLISTVTNQMATDSKGAGRAWNPTSGHVTLPAFLYLAMVCFVSPKEPPEDASQEQPPTQKRSLGSSAGPGGRRLYIRDRDQDKARKNPEKRACATAVGGGSDDPIAALSPPTTTTPGDRRALGASSAAAAHGVLSLSQVSPSSPRQHGGSPFRSWSPSGGAEWRETSGGTGSRHLRRPVGPALTSLQSPPILRHGQQHQEQQRTRRQADPQRREEQQSPAPSTPPARQQQQQQQQQQRQQGQQRPATNSLEPVEGPRGMAQQQQQQHQQQQRNNGGGNGGGSPTTPTILEWGLNSLLSYVRGGDEEGMRQGGSNAQDALSAFSPASSRAAWQEGSSPPRSPPTPARSTSARSARESGREQQQGSTEKETEAITNIHASDGGRGAAVGPAKHATGGGRVSPSASAGLRPGGGQSASFDTARDKDIGSRSGGNCADVGAPRGRAVHQAAGGKEEAATHDQLQRQSSSAASAGRAAGPPPSPASMVVDSLRSRYALSPLALLARFERRSRSCSRSASPTPTPKDEAKDEGRAGTPLELTCGRKKEERNHGGVAPRAGVGTDASTALSPSGSEGFGADKGPGGCRRATAKVAFADDGQRSSAPHSRGGTCENATDDASAGHLIRSDGPVRDRAEFSHDVASAAAAWLASFEQRFMPCLVAEATAGADGAGAAGARRAAGSSTAKAAVGVVPASSDGREGGAEAKDGLLPAAISRVLHEEVFRVLEQRRRDLDIVERVSPELLRSAVVKSFWMFEESVSTPRAHAHALSNMGRLLEDRGSPNEALLCFQEASTADRSSAEALCCRGGNLLRRGDLDGAAFFFEGALARDESHWSAWHGLGQVKSAQGKHADTVEALSRWLDGQKNEGAGGESGRGISGVGVGVGENGRAEGAAGAKGAAAAMAMGLVQLGDAHRKLGQEKEAQIAYERAVSMDEGCSQAHFQLGSLFQARGAHDTEAALRAFALAVKTAAAAGSAAELDNVQGLSGVVRPSFLA